MKNFINTFKAKAHSKELTCADMIALCIYRTMKAKSEDKSIILTHFLKKTFTAGKVCAHRQWPYQTISLTMYYLNSDLRPRRRWTPDGFRHKTNGKLLGEEITDLLTEEEEKAFRELATIVFDSNFVKAL